MLSTPIRISPSGGFLEGNEAAPDAATGDIVPVWNDTTKQWETRKLAGGGGTQLSLPEQLSVLFEYPLTFNAGDTKLASTSNFAGPCTVPLLIPTAAWAGLQWSVAPSLDGLSLKVTVSNLTPDAIGPIDVADREWTLVRSFVP